MALSNLQALDVVLGCIRGVTQRAANPTKTLKANGVTDEPRLQAFKGLVVTDRALGVRKFRHEIKPAALNGLSVDDQVQAVADVVRANATPALTRARRARGATSTRKASTGTRKAARQPKPPGRPK